jgi:hypothetical protein
VERGWLWVGFADASYGGDEGEGMKRNGMDMVVSGWITPWMTAWRPALLCPYGVVQRTVVLERETSAA